VVNNVALLTACVCPHPATTTRARICSTLLIRTKMAVHESFYGVQLKSEASRPFLVNFPLERQPATYLTRPFFILYWLRFRRIAAYAVISTPFIVENNLDTPQGCTDMPKTWQPPGDRRH